MNTTPQLVGIYLQDNGIPAVVYAAPSALETMTMNEVLTRVVPAGRPFAIIPESDLPADLSLHGAWVVSEEDLTDGIGTQENV
jgi:hypothetical protein